jgi:hypothetical protein
MLSESTPDVNRVQGTFDLVRVINPLPNGKHRKMKF